MKIKEIRANLSMPDRDVKILREALASVYGPRSQPAPKCTCSICMKARRKEQEICLTTTQGQ